MVNKFFQNILNKISGGLDQGVEILDDKLEIVASTKLEDQGKVRNLNFIEISASDTLAKNGFTYKVFGSKTFGEYVLGVEGTDEPAFKLASILYAPLEASAKFYGEKHSRTEFVKNIILDNFLPGDITLKAKELKISEDSGRVCILFKYVPRSNVSVFNLLINMFPDGTKDFVINLDDEEIAVIKEVCHGISDSDLEKLASSVVSTLATEHYIKSAAGIGTIVNNISDLGDSFRAAQVALEVRKVFENEKIVAIFSQLGIARLIYQLPVSLCKVFLKEVFKKCTVDAIDQELMFTIHKFFENSLNISETSRKLFVHRNTLVYRIDKIKRITGLDLRDFEDAIVFKVALMVSKYLKESASKY
jgi:carbohydrate diacid regulator